MLLDVDTAIFTTADQTPVADLIKLVAQEQHDWYPDLPGALCADEFVGRLTATVPMPIMSEWARHAAVQAADPPPHDARRPLRVDGSDLRDRVDDLAKPAVLLVENELGDGSFVRVVAQALGDHRIVRSLGTRPRWLVFSHGGGKDQLPLLAAERCAEFSVVMRVAVLLDSDRADPTAEGNKAKLDAVRDAGVEHAHMLTLRMMENYVPFRVWEEHFAHQPERVRTLRAKVPQQRGYLHLKRYFGDRSFPSRLFGPDTDLTEEDFAELGDDVVTELRVVLAMIHEVL